MVGDGAEETLELSRSGVRVDFLAWVSFFYLGSWVLFTAGDFHLVYFFGGLCIAFRVFVFFFTLYILFFFYNWIVCIYIFQGSIPLLFSHSFGIPRTRNPGLLGYDVILRPYTNDHFLLYTPSLYKTQRWLSIPPEVYQL